MLDGVDWPGSAPPDERVLLERGASIEADLAVRQRAFAYLRKALARPEMRVALSPRPGEEVGAEVWCERTFCEILQEPEGRVMRRGAFDRVVLQIAEGRVTAATIQDYKTDAVELEGLQKKVDHYTPQIDVYRRVLAQMTGLGEEHIRAELLFLSQGWVREIPLRTKRESPA
jgi:ATP-dependent exoDNAse (exonuclease V) beta subunit